MNVDALLPLALALAFIMFSLGLSLRGRPVSPSASSGNCCCRWRRWR